MCALFWCWMPLFALFIEIRLVNVFLPGVIWFGSETDHGLRCYILNTNLSIKHNLLMCTQWSYRLSTKRQPIQILFVWPTCPLWLFSDPSVLEVQLLPWLTQYTHLNLFLMLSLIFVMISNILFGHHKYKYYWDVDVHVYFFWAIDLGSKYICR